MKDLTAWIVVFGLAALFFFGGVAVGEKNIQFDCLRYGKTKLLQDWYECSLKEVK